MRSKMIEIREIYNRMCVHTFSAVGGTGVGTTGSVVDEDAAQYTSRSNVVNTGLRPALAFIRPNKERERLQHALQTLLRFRQRTQTFSVSLHAKCGEYLSKKSAMPCSLEIPQKYGLLLNSSNPGAQS